MDIYSTASLNRVVARMRPLPTLFLSTFFRQQINSTTEEIYFDQKSDKPRIAPFVHPLRQGKLVEDLGYSTQSFKPAYIKDKRVHNPLKALKRVAGEALLGEYTPEQRLQMILASDLQDQKDMLLRRLELMAIEGVLSGTQTVKGDGFDAVVNFGRDAALTITLSGGAKWDDSSKTTQADDLETWSSLMLDKSGYGGGLVIMDLKAWKLFKRTANFDKLLDRNYKAGDGTNLDLAPRFAAEGAVYRGNVGDFEIWTYTHKYVNDAGTLVDAMPDNTVLLASPTGLEGVRHFGAILDIKAGLRATDQFVKSWEEEDPSVRYLLSQSAPLMVPYRTNASIRITVA